MNELPEDLLTTNKLLYLTWIDGESQIPLMKILAEIAAELSKTEEWFYAMIPFGSRTKWLSEKDSDLDILIIVDDDRELWVWHIINEKLVNKGIIIGVEIYAMKKWRYIECMSSEMWTEIECNAIAGIMVWPNKMEDTNNYLKKLKRSKKEMVISHITFLIYLAMHFGDSESRIEDKNIRKLYIENRLRLWETRIRNLLDCPKKN